MRRPPEMLGLSYYQTVKGYTYNKRRKTFVPRREEAIVLIHPYKWYEGAICLSEALSDSIALKRDDAMRNTNREGPQFATAARRALLLYLPFTDFDRLTDLSQIARGQHEDVERYDLTRNNDGLWSTLFLYWLAKEPHLFPHEIHQLVQGIDENDFNLVIDPDNMTDDEPIDPPPRREQEWQ